MNTTDIRKRAEAATPGPWEAGRPDMATIVDGVDSKWIYAGAKRQYCAVASGRIKGPWSEVIANADFIAHARQDIPYLLDTVDALRGEVEGAKARQRLAEEGNTAMAHRVAYLEGECASVRDGAEKDRRGLLAAAQIGREELNEQVTRLRDALEKYTEHTKPCQFRMERGRECSCGLDGALAQARGTP